MIFFWLGLAALCFGLLGFFLHAFYFNKQEREKEVLSKDLENLKRTLAFRQRANQDAQEEIAKTRMLVQSLERQLEQRNDQMNALQNMAQRQEQEIRLLQRAASEIRTTAVRTDDDSRAGIRGSVVKSRDSAFSTESGISSHELSESKEQKIPLWKDNLNNILSMLDRIEKEVKR